MKNSNQLRTGNSIMNFPKNDLFTTCRNFLNLFDDYMQKSEDQGKDDLVEYFADSFDKLEALSRKLMDGEEATLALRNQIRMLVKETEKMAIAEFH